MKHLNLLSEYSPEHTWTVGVGEIKHTINTVFASTTNYLSHFIFMAYIFTNTGPPIVAQRKSVESGRDFTLAGSGTYKRRSGLDWLFGFTENSVR